MDDIDKEFIELYQTIGSVSGLDNLFVTLFAKLYIEPEDMAMENIAKETGYSLASVSNKVKVLETMGIVKRIKKPGSKKIFLRIEKDMIKIFKEHLAKKEEKNIKLIKEKIPEIIKKYKHKVKTEKDKKKIKILENYYKQILKTEKIISHIRIEMEKI